MNVNIMFCKNVKKQKKQAKTILVPILMNKMDE